MIGRTPLPRLPNPSSTAITTVWIAIPPRMLPAATSIDPDRPGADGDGDLGQVRGDGQDDEAAERTAQVQAGVEHVRRLRELDAGDPDDGRSRDEDEREQQRGRDSTLRPWTAPAVLSADLRAVAGRRRQGSAHHGRTMNDVDARMDRLRKAARYRYQQLEDAEVERGSLDPDEVRAEREERRLLKAADVAAHARAQIAEAERRGVFEGNPYHGKPLPGLDRGHDPNWWIKAKIEREDIRGIATARPVAAHRGRRARRPPGRAVGGVGRAGRPGRLQRPGEGSASAAARRATRSSRRCATSRPRWPRGGSAGRPGSPRRDGCGRRRGRDPTVPLVAPARMSREAPPGRPAGSPP